MFMQVTIDDNLYQNLVEHVGQANISHYVQKDVIIYTDSPSPYSRGG